MRRILTLSLILGSAAFAAPPAKPPPRPMPPPVAPIVPVRGAPASFADMAARLLPTVVNIATTLHRGTRGQRSLREKIDPETLHNGLDPLETAIDSGFNDHA